MKIAFVTQPFDVVSQSNSSSLAIWVHEVSTRVAKHHEVVVYSRKVPHLVRNEYIGRVKHVRVSMIVDDMLGKLLKGVDRIIRTLFHTNWSVYHRYYYFQWFYYVFYTVSVARQLHRSDVDVAIILNFSQFIPIIKLFSKDTKTIIVMQCDWLIELDRKQISRRLSRNSAITGCSDYITRGIKQRFPQYEERCYTLYNGSDPLLFNPNRSEPDISKDIRADLGLDDEQIILYVGRITPEKGVHVLIEAMKLIWQTRANTKLLIVGGFHNNPPSPLWLRNDNSLSTEFESFKMDYEGYLNTLARGYEHKVLFIDAVPHDRLVSFYSLSDVFVHPSLWNEPFGMILIEAMSCEIPVVSTRVGGIPEVVVEGKTGLLTAPDDPQALANAILQLFRNRDQRRKMGVNGRERVKSQFTWDQTAEVLESILDAI